MKRTILFFVSLLISTLVFSQKVKTVERNKICDVPKKTYGTIEPVSEFKDSLKAIIQIRRITLGANSEEVDKTFTEMIKNESSVFKVTNEMAISVSIGRVEENGFKFYIYKIHLFRKIKGCWEDSSWDTSWTKFNLGNFTGGYGYGNEGASGFIRFSGNITVE